jgi:2-dehydropantoate 2-reductase
MEFGTMAGLRICVLGAGAMGGLLGARLAAAGEAVSLIARGDHLAAMRANGLRLIARDGDVVVNPPCTDDAEAIGVQDVVILAVKATALRGAADAVRPLLGPETVLVPALNGVPWWYFYGLPGPHADRRLDSVDPGGELWRKLPPERVIGCVVYAAGEIVAPGVVRSSASESFLLGDPAGRLGPRVAALSAIFETAGLKAPVSLDIRRDLWIKLWGNLSFNPLSVLTGATLDQLALEAESRDVARRMMIEARDVAERLGIAFPMDVDARMAMAEGLRGHKTSMLQDFERGSPLEIDALLGAVIEMARLVGVATPTCEIVFNLVRQRARVAGGTRARRAAP